MRNLQCPQCEIHRFYVKNELDENRLVTIDQQFDVIPVNPDESLDGFDLTMLYCLGCSWKGSPKSLKNGSHKRHR
jgi:hypothetical protein